MRGRPGRGGAGGPETPDSIGARSPETGAGSLPFRVPPAPPLGVQRHRARNPVILSDDDLAVMQKAVAAARPEGKDDRQDAAAGQHGTGPSPGPPESLPASEPASDRQVWAVLYDGGMSLTTASERIVRGLAEAERQGGCHVTVRRLDDVQTHPGGVEKPARPPKRARGKGPVRPGGSDKPPGPGPGKAMGGTDRAPEPAAVRRLNENRARRHRRLLLYALAAASIVVAAAVSDHWGVLPRVGADTGSSPAQVGGPAHRGQLLPPLGQPPVMRFSSAVGSASVGPAAPPARAAAEPSGGQNPAAQPTGPPTSAESPQSATAKSSGGGPSTIARGG